jgi:hypothetical protein
MFPIRQYRLTALLLGITLSGSAAEPIAPSANFTDTVKPFLATYCVTCHGPAKQKGDRRFDVLDGQIADDNALIDLQDILDQLNLGEMPPKEAKQPTSTERQAAIRWLTAATDDYRDRRKAPAAQTVLRRLNAREYKNTVRDLLHLETAMFDPTAGFPRDSVVEHLDNVGASLVTSGDLLAKYLAAAERVIEKALFPLQQPEVQKWHFAGGFRQQPEIDQVHRFYDFDKIRLYDVIGADKHEGAYGYVYGFREGVPHDGYYNIRFKAEALNRQHPYDREFVGTDPDEPLRLGIVPGSLATGHLHKPQPIEPLLTEMELADGLKWYTARVWLDAGYTPRFTFRNGLMDARTMWGRLVRKYRDQFPPRVRGGIVEDRRYAIMHGKLPQIHIHEVEIEGPFYDQWPRASQRDLLGEAADSALSSGELTEPQMRAALQAFASRAYRRPATDDEINRLMKVVEVRRQAGRSAIEAYRDTLLGVLCSPAFLYLEEPPGERISSHALASRLSYFLWSSMPDEELLRLAASGELLKPDVLKTQALRLLADKRSDALVEGFLDSWLTLRDLGSQPPDRVKFESYHRFDLGTAMRRETQLFTRHLLDENLSIANFLDSDFTFVNRPLARHYGIEPPAGYEFTKVKLASARRGGLLGQASVLTVTANGIDTSPVIRGVWLLENILGTPPSPPPPDVEPLDPDIRGATTIREQLEKHRHSPACFDCHQKIDPPGFALENFDAVGAWREHYETSSKALLPIDAAGALPTGEAFSDITGFKTLLAARQDQFARCLTEKLLAYATGRVLDLADRPHVDRLVERAKSDGYGLKDLVLLVVLSEPFQRK